jgi:hypothetical protein
LKGLRLREKNPDRRTFDDHDNCPVEEEMVPIPHLFLAWDGDVVYFDGEIVDDPWNTHRDYGLRLEPDFAQAFDLPSPIMVQEHLMPVGASECNRGDAIDDLNAFFEQATMDGIRMGAGDMIEYANISRSDDIFVTGRTSDGCNVILDLEKDKVEDPSIIKAVDLDSVIWVTRHPRFLKSIDIYTRMVIRNTPPITKHNHVYVNLLHPPSRENPDAHRETKLYRLSRIPHLFLGRLGGGTGTVNLYMFFPRMTHKHPHVPRYANMVPWYLQATLWREVVIPAMKSVLSPADEAYAALDTDHVAFKDDGSSVESTYPLDRMQFINFVKKMNEIVSSHLTRFFG